MMSFFMIAKRVFDKTPIWLRITNFDKSNAYISVCGIHNKDESDLTFNEKDRFKDKSTKDKNELHLKTHHDGRDRQSRKRFIRILRN